MLRLCAVMLALLVPGAALAADWQYEGGAIPIAYVDDGAAQLHFACRGGDLAMGYWVRAPHRDVAGGSTMSVALTPDPPGGSTFFAQDMPLIHADGSSVIVRGPVTQQWAKLAMQAKTAMRVAYARQTAAGKLDYLDSHEFGASGSAAAIRKVLAICG
ncbi:hypothetical protein [Devosia sp.]|uniref:hypothetical protein n=1 Tax=Devosia sp. TaxID=1871048 RepID=UPI003A94202B